MKWIQFGHTQLTVHFLQQQCQTRVGKQWTATQTSGQFFGQHVTSDCLRIIWCRMKINRKITCAHLKHFFGQVMQCVRLQKGRHEIENSHQNTWVTFAVDGIDDTVHKVTAHGGQLLNVSTRKLLQNRKAFLTILAQLTLTGDMLKHGLHQARTNSGRNTLHPCNGQDTGQCARQHRMMITQSVAIECGNEIDLGAVQMASWQVG